MNFYYAATWAAVTARCRSLGWRAHVDETRTHWIDGRLSVQPLGSLATFGSGFTLSYSEESRRWTWLWRKVHMWVLTFIHSVCDGVKSEKSPTLLCLMLLFIYSLAFFLLIGSKRKHLFTVGGRHASQQRDLWLVRLILDRSEGCCGFPPTV